MNRFFQIIFVLLFVFYSFNIFAAENQLPEIPRFDIKNYQVEGNTKLSQTEIEATLAGFTGIKKNFGTVQEALESLELLYHKRGYITTKVILPEQKLKNGIIRFVIIEGLITSVKIQGNKFFNDKNIRRSLPALKEGEQPDINKISTSLKVANEHPAKKITMKLAPGDNQREITAYLKVTDEKAWKVSLLGDNTGNSDTGVYRAGVLLQYNNLFNLDQLVTMQYTTSPEKADKVSIFGFGYRVPIYSWGDSIDLYASYSDVDSGTIYAGTSDIKVSGRGVSAGVRYNQNLARIGGYEHKLSYGIDHRKYQSNALITSTWSQDSDIALHPVSLTYSSNFQFKGGQTGLNLSLNRNIPGGTNATDDDFRRVRSVANPSYTILRYGANFLYGFSNDILLRLLASGQYTNDPLVPGEQFGLGGASSVRGFQEREVSDDRGNFGSIEIYTPDICKLMNITKAKFRMLAFFDVGEVSRVSPLPAEESYTQISSVGTGLRLEIGTNFTLAADYGYATGVDGSRAVRNNRFHLSGMLSF